MNKDKILKTAVIPGFAALAVVLLSVLTLVSPIGVAGFITVLILVGIAALEYRLSFKKLFGR